MQSKNRSHQTKMFKKIQLQVLHIWRRDETILYSNDPEELGTEILGRSAKYDAFKN